MPAANPAYEVLRKSGFTRRLQQQLATHFDGNITKAAGVIGVSYDELWNIATGRTKNPSLAFLTKLSKWSKLSIDWWVR